MKTRGRIGMAVVVVVVALVGAGAIAASFGLRSDDKVSSAGETPAPPRSVAVAEPSSSVASPSESELHTLFGDVVNDSGEPIVRATVQARLTNGRIETRATDDDGMFMLDGLAGTSVIEVTFTASGYQRAVVMGSALPTIAEAHWSQKLAKSTDAPQGIGGTVVDDRGQPVTAFRLVTMPRDGDERTKRRGLRVEPVDDEGGVFERADIAAPVSVQVLAPKFRPYSLDMKPGDRTRISLVRSNVLRGRVTDRETGAAIVGATVSLDGMRTIGTSTTDESGAYEIDTLPVEKVSVNVRADGYLPLTLGGIEGGRSRDEVLHAKLTRATAGVSTEVVGIGVNVGRHDEGVLVRGVIDGGPARDVLVEGDIIVEADGVSLGGRPLREGMAAIRGEPGTSVRLRVKRADAFFDTRLERARVAVPDG